MSTHDKFVRKSGLRPLTYNESKQYLKEYYGPEYAHKLNKRHMHDLKGKVRRIEKQALKEYCDRWFKILQKLRRGTFYGIKIAKNQRTTIAFDRFY